VICHRPFDFAGGQVAVVLKHIAYGYDYAHEGACLAAARELIFVDPEYDRPAFSTDGQRARILRTYAANGWTAVLPNAPDQVLGGEPVSFEPLLCWVVVESCTGSRRVEGLMREPDLVDEPGAAEFPEARQGRRQSLGYARAADRSNPAMRALWESVVRARYSTIRC
jgi:hypothetical protein